MSGYFLFTILSAFFLALQGALMAVHFRNIDELSTVAYRGLSLGISFAPLLLLVPEEAFGTFLSTQIPMLLFAGFIAAFANTCAGISLRKLTVALANTIGFSAAALMSLLIDVFVYERSFSLYQLGLIALLFVTLFFFSVGDGKRSLVREGGILVGVGYAAVFGFLIGIAGAMVGELSKGSHPFVIGYTWEVAIGTFALFYCFVRKALGGEGFSVIPLRTFGSILLYASPTAAGTGLYLYALTLGPLAIVSALQSTIMVFSLFFGALIFKERFGSRELILLLVITSLVIALRYVSVG